MLEKNKNSSLIALKPVLSPISYRISSIYKKKKEENFSRLDISRAKIIRNSRGGRDYLEKWLESNIHIDVLTDYSLSFQLFPLIFSISLNTVASHDPFLTGKVSFYGGGHL